MLVFFWKWVSFLFRYPKSGEGNNGNPLQYSCLENPLDRGAWWAAVHGVAKSRTRLSDFTCSFHFHVLEKEMVTHYSILAWRIPGMGEPGGLMSVGSHRVRHDWSDLATATAAARALYMIKKNMHFHSVFTSATFSLGTTFCMKKSCYKIFRTWNPRKYFRNKYTHLQPIPNRKCLLLKTNTIVIKTHILIVSYFPAIKQRPHYLASPFLYEIMRTK